MSRLPFVSRNPRIARVPRVALALAFAAIVAACAHLHTVDPDALWKIVSMQCVPSQRDHGNPGNCTTVDLQKRYAILKDISGKAQHLLIPTDRVTGIESDQILYAGSPNYWLDAWGARHDVDASLHHALNDQQVGLEINSKFARSQQQLHIHIDCMRTDVTAALDQHASDPPLRWRWETLDGQRYRVMRVTALTGDQDPFRIVARDHTDSAAMATQTILVTGAGTSAAQSGWFVVNSGTDVDRGSASAEVLLDHSCKVVDSQ
ncbi:CDP-diacylglycerol diphosphatase [Paraburkholderia phosphatilytica]|uniref:CDP-diacylglycerol diphosphatase n=1 Tax=Paraburkholderia phosphatilytica TaxID=2282883 RepID=UPI000E4B3649|nr:CDP-diacylglycerol diphosphatase [Paraburkholderia phosphatilytica]